MTNLKRRRPRLALQFTRAYRYFESVTGDKYGELRDMRRRLEGIDDHRYGVGVRTALARVVRLHRGADRFARS